MFPSSFKIDGAKMIHTHNLICSYGSRDVLHGINLSIRKGEFVGIIGPNGSGKTTLLKALNGLLPYTGEIKIHGIQLNELSVKQRSKLLSTVPQSASDGMDMRVESLVLMGRYPYLGLFSGYSETDMAAVEQALLETNTAKFIGRRACELSGGELQGVFLARALAQQTEILLLDEATSGLDFSRSIDVFDLLAKKNDNGSTILSVVHDLNLAALYCTRIIMLKDGMVKYDGNVKDVFTSANLEQVYETKISIAKHPTINVPQALYIPGDNNKS